MLPTADDCSLLYEPFSDQPGRAELRPGGGVLQQFRENHGRRSVFRVPPLSREVGRGRRGGPTMVNAGGEAVFKRGGRTRRMLE